MNFENALKSLGVESFKGTSKIICPWHEGDTDPSLSVDANAGVFYCFGCGEKGGVIKLLAKLTGKDELQALIGAGSDFVTMNTAERTDRGDLCDDARDYFYSIGKPSWEVIKHHYMIDKRRISPVVLQKFDVRINSSSEYPVIVPIMEGREFKGYVMRRIDVLEPKYLYNEGFLRRSTVFGKLRQGAVMVVEGSFDLMSAIQFGFKNTCCTLGASVTNEQIRKIGKGASVVICAFDNDRAGEEGFYSLRSSLPNVVRLSFPDGVKDVNEMTKKQFKASLVKLLKELRNGSTRRY